MFNHKLYKEYYPINNEKVFQEFWENYRNKLRVILCNEIKRLELCEFQLNNKYAQQLKNTVSFCGNIKYKNIIHNEYVFKKKERDRKFDVIKDNYEKTCNILEKFELNETISIEEANEILKMEQSQFIDDICPFIKAAIGVGFVLLIYWMH